MAERTCSIDDCEDPVKARGWCDKHWKRWRKHGDPLAAPQPGAAATPEAETERRRKIGEASRGRKLGPRSEETRRKLSDAMTGRPLSDAHRQAIAAAGQANRDRTTATSRAQWEKWREENDKPLGYFGAHRRVRKTRGPAKFQTCVDCGKAALHWAHIHDTDPTDPQNYRPMCARCHYAYDQVGSKSVATKGPEGRRAIALKAWETKRRRQVQQDVAPDPALARLHDGEPEHVGNAAQL